jgi:hypothetical protein
MAAIVLLLLTMAICLYHRPFRYAVLELVESFGWRSRSKRRGISDFEALADQQEATPELQQELFALVQGDRALAEQWLTKARFGHSGQPEDYYWRRAIALLQQTRKAEGDGC